MVLAVIRPWLPIAGACLLLAGGCSQGKLDMMGQSPPAPLAQAEPTVEETFSFEDAEVGKVPARFSTALTGGGGPGAWAVREDQHAFAGKKVLVQDSHDRTDYRFPVCVYDGLTAKDVEVWVRFRAAAGEVDRAAGIVVRYQDRDNYYVARANAIEHNVRLYKVVNGQRWQLAGVDAQVTSDQWHMLRLAIQGTHFRVSLDGKLLFEADDGTIDKAGKIGLWTKADSVTSFDELKVEAHDRR